MTGPTMTRDQKLALFGEGPWLDEPDRYEWRLDGLACLITRNDSLGTLCGYVGVPPGHPWHGKHYDAPLAEVHGGLTFAGPCTGHICHVPQPGEPDDVWWLGFDCGHCFDITPALSQIMGRVLEECPTPDWMPKTVYRDLEYVRGEVERLAAQAKAAVS
jgi:hypothetical protein